MGQYLQWEEAKPIRDTSECLLVDEPKHYTHLIKEKAPKRETLRKEVSFYLNTKYSDPEKIGVRTHIKYNYL